MGRHPARPTQCFAQGFSADVKSRNFRQNILRLVILPELPQGSQETVQLEAHFLREMGTSNDSDEFNRDAVQQIRVRGYPVREVSRRLGDEFALAL